MHRPTSLYSPTLPPSLWVSSTSPSASAALQCLRHSSSRDEPPFPWSLRGGTIRRPFPRLKRLLSALCNTMMGTLIWLWSCEGIGTESYLELWVAERDWICLVSVFSNHPVFSLVSPFGSFWSFIIFMLHFRLTYLGCCLRLLSARHDSDCVATFFNKRETGRNLKKVVVIRNPRQ